MRDVDFNLSFNYKSGAQRAGLCGEIISCVTYLSQDPFANYVVQHLIQNDSQFLEEVVNALLAASSLPGAAPGTSENKFMELCCHKFSSNVQSSLHKLDDFFF